MQRALLLNLKLPQNQNLHCNNACLSKCVLYPLCWTRKGNCNFAVVFSAYSWMLQQRCADLGFLFDRWKRTWSSTRTALISSSSKTRPCLSSTALLPGSLDTPSTLFTCSGPKLCAPISFAYPSVDWVKPHCRPWSKHRVSAYLFFTGKVFRKMWWGTAWFSLLNPGETALVNPHPSSPCTEGFRICSPQPSCQGLMGTFFFGTPVTASRQHVCFYYFYCEKWEKMWLCMELLYFSKHDGDWPWSVSEFYSELANGVV